MLDSLLSVHSKNDTARVNLLNNAAEMYLKTEIERSFELSNEAKQTAVKLKYSKGEAASLRIIAQYYNTISENNKALKSFKESFRINIEIKDINFVATELYNIVAIHNKLGNCCKALLFFDKSIEFSQLFDAKQVL